MEPNPMTPGQFIDKVLEYSLKAQIQLTYIRFEKRHRGALTFQWQLGNLTFAYPVTQLDFESAGKARVDYAATIVAKARGYLVTEHQRLSYGTVNEIQD